MSDLTATLAQLRARAAGARALATRRLLTPDDIDRFQDALEAAQERGATRVRVYAGAGFVPNSYRWPCSIQHVEARRETPGGAWTVTTGSGGAQRSGGRGSLTVIIGGST